MLQQAADGDSQAFDDVVEQLHADLERSAAFFMRQQLGAAVGAVTLEPAALVNEVFIKLLDQRSAFQNRQHFFAIANRIMMRVLVDYHRKRSAQKRGGGAVRVTLTGINLAQAPEPAVDILQLTQVLHRLESLDPRKAEVVKLRGLWGLQMSEIASTLEISLATAERDWRFAKSWIISELEGRPDR